MTRKIIQLALSITLCTILFTSCSKYEEGPRFSVKSRKSRVSNTWVMDKYLTNYSDVETDVTASLGEYSWEFVISKDGNYTWHIENGGSVADRFGTWEFSGKAGFIILEDGVPAIEKQEWTISRLKSDELWIRDSDAEDYTEIRFTQK